MARWRARRILPGTAPSSRNGMAGQLLIPFDYLARPGRAGLDLDALVRLVKLLLAVSVVAPACAARAAQASDHFDGRRFHNRGSVPEPTVPEEAKVGWEMRTKKKNWPDPFETKRSEGPREPVLRGIRVLWIGHAGALIQTPSLNIITDPV